MTRDDNIETGSSFDYISIVNMLSDGIFLRRRLLIKFHLLEMHYGRLILSRTNDLSCIFLGLRVLRIEATRVSGHFRCRRNLEE